MSTDARKELWREPGSVSAEDGVAACLRCVVAWSFDDEGVTCQAGDGQLDGRAGEELRKDARGPGACSDHEACAGDVGLCGRIRVTNANCRELAAEVGVDGESRGWVVEVDAL